jgi:hypothetical protein
MKIKSLLILFAAVTCGIVFSSYREGAATYGGWQCTGSETDQSNPNGCKGSGCHAASATPGIAITLELDSAGISTTHYVGGGSYTVKITGTNNTASSLPKFGFQISCIKDTIPQAAPTNEGTWPGPFAAGTQYTAPLTYYLAGVVEHNTPLAPTSGTGAKGTIYSETFNWTAPAKGTGTISFWGVLNAVNYNGTQDAGDLWNSTKITVHELGTTGISSIEDNSLDMSIFPNPATAQATLTYTLKANRNVQADLYDIYGNKITPLFSDEQNTGEHQQMVNLSALNLKSGMYLIVIDEGNTLSCKKLIVQ